MDDELYAKIEELLDLTAGDSRLPDGFTLENIARGLNGNLHVPQLGYMSSVALRILLMCSRRAGKTWGIGGRYAFRSMLTPGGNRAYIALTKDQAREIMWEPIWKPLCAAWGLCTPNDHNETRMVTTFPNGSRCRFTGSDDLRHIATELGAAADEVTIDESQDQPSDVLKALATKILPPALGDRGVLTISGVYPEVHAGYYWNRREVDTWDRRYFSMFDNPHYPNPQTVVDNFLRDNPHLTIDSPIVQRDYYGNPVYDEGATAYRYNSARMTYTPEAAETVMLGPFRCTWAKQPTGCDRVIVGIDQAQRRDRFAMVGHTWDHLLKNKLYQLFEAVTEPGADPTESDWLEVCKEARRRYGGSMEFIRDAGGSSAPVNDLLKRSHGIVVVSAVKGPGSVKARVQRYSDLLVKGVAQVIEGSELDADLASAKWDGDALERGKWELDKSHKSPDVADAASYALDLPSFTQIGGMKPPAPRPTLREQLDAAQAKTLADMMKPQMRQPMRARTLADTMWGRPK